MTTEDVQVIEAQEEIRRFTKIIGNYQVLLNEPHVAPDWLIKNEIKFLQFMIDVRVKALAQFAKTGHGYIKEQSSA